MKRNVLLAIDLGTTVLKVCAFDARTGALLAQAARRLDVITVPGGGREQDPAAVDRAFRGAIAGLRREVGDDWSRVEGVGLASQGGSSIVADRATGRALTPMILWNDARGHAYTPEVLARFPAAFWRRFALRDVPPAGLGRLLWVRQTRPELFRGDTIHAGAGEYLFHQLTGLWRQDAGNAIQIGPYNAATRRLDATPLELLGMPLSFVAPLRQGHETAPLAREAAALLRLREGIPVAGPYIDQEAGYLSAAAASARPLQCSLGTAWVGNFAMPDEAPGYSPFQLVLGSPAGPGRLVIQPLLTGNASWDWGLERLLGARHGVALRRASALLDEAPCPPEGLYAIPWLTQPNTHFPGAYGAGTFWGVSAESSPADLVRAIACGMVFELARVFDEVKRSGAVDCVVLTGGASKGAFFRMATAAVFDPLPVRRQVDEDLGAARGALYTFGARVCRGTLEPVPLPRPDLRQALTERCQGYLGLFSTLYGSVPQGRPYTFGRRKR